MGYLHTIDEKEILAGKTTDIYFENTKTLLTKLNRTKTKVVADFTVSGLPLDWEWAVFLGLEEIIQLMKGKNIDLYALPEGTIFQNRSKDGVLVPVMMISGPYNEFCIYETPMLGLCCQSSGIGTKTARLRKLIGGKTMLSFGIRRIHPAVSYMVDRSCYIGGCDTVSCVASAEKLGITPRGTMPHALTIIAGNPANGFRAFDKHLPGSIQRIALVDTYQDEVREAIIAAESIPHLEGVRLDTPASRRGNFKKIVQELRWELDIRGFEHVKIYVSGGINENNIKDLVDAGVNGFGVGTTLVNAPVLDFAMDIVELEEKPVAKRGKFGGKKQVYRCPKCLEIEVLSKPAKKDMLCNNCGDKPQEAMKKYLSNGQLIQKLPKPDAIKAYVDQQLEKIKID